MLSPKLIGSTINSYPFRKRNIFLLLEVRRHVQFMRCSSIMGCGVRTVVQYSIRYSTVFLFWRSTVQSWTSRVTTLYMTSGIANDIVAVLILHSHGSMVAGL